MRLAEIGARLTGWRLPAIETWPRLVAFAQTWPGRLALLALFAALLKAHAFYLAALYSGLWSWSWLALAAAAVAYAGRYRLPVLLACTLAFLARRMDWFNYQPVRLIIDQQGLYGTVDHGYLRAATLAGCVLVGALALHLARRYRDRPLGRRPVLALHVAFVALLVLAASNMLRGLPQVVLWSVVVVTSAYFWYFAWALIDQRQRRPPPVLSAFATFNPFLWHAFVPLGKGAANWRSVEAANAEELAVTQLKALKLSAWALVLANVLWAFQAVAHGQFGVPPFTQAFGTILSGGRVPFPFGIFSIVTEFVSSLLVMAVWGHIFVALARFAGFRLLRNTWRPLSARTIAEFWNRFNYYFKEVMVAVYFYPTYLRWFKRHPRLRLAFATFMAAGVGNFFFHFIMLKHQTVVLYGMVEALVRMQGYAFYCAVLTTGIVASQLFGGRPDANAGWVRARLLPFLLVAGFFCFLVVFDRPQQEASLGEHFRILFHLLGVARLLPGTS